MDGKDIKLKGCPFCGSEPHYTSDEDAYSYTTYGRPWFVIGCESCDIHFRDKEIWDKNSLLTKECYPKDSFDRWNKRQKEPNE